MNHRSRIRQMSMEPETTLDPQFSSPDVKPTPWSAATDALRDAKTYLLTTVRPDGRPHQTTVAGIWIDGAFHFGTGPSERKARNLAAGNHNILVSVATPAWEGLDVVIEGEAVPVTDLGRLGRLFEAYATKYDDVFGFRLVDGEVQAPGVGDPPLFFEVRASKAFGFGKGTSFSQTRWRFS
jgi:pyridoxamine 5'-phosphate oxidase-like protein